MGQNLKVAPTAKKIKVGSLGELEINDLLKKRLEQEYYADRQKRIDAGESVNKRDAAFNNAMTLLSNTETGLAGINSAGLFYGQDVGGADNKSRFKRKVFGIKNEDDHMKDALSFISNSILKSYNTSAPTSPNPATGTLPMTESTATPSVEVPLATGTTAAGTLGSTQTSTGTTSTSTTSTTGGSQPSSSSTTTGAAGTTTPLTEADVSTETPVTKPAIQPVKKFTYDNTIDVLDNGDGTYSYVYSDHPLNGDFVGKPVDLYIPQGAISTLPNEFRGIIYGGLLIKDLDAYRKLIEAGGDTNALITFNTHMQLLIEDSKQRALQGMSTDSRRAPMMGALFWDNRTGLFGNLQGDRRVYSLIKPNAQGFWDNDYIMTKGNGDVEYQGNIGITKEGKYFMNAGPKRRVTFGDVNSEKLNDLKKYITYESHVRPGEIMRAANRKLPITNPVSITMKLEGGRELNILKVKDYKNFMENYEKDKLSSANTSAIFNNASELTDADKAELAGLTLDLGGLVAGFVPGGNFVSGAAGLAGTAASHYANYERSGKVDWAGLGTSLGLDVISAIPVAGQAAKFAKVAKTVAKIKPWLATAFVGAGLKGAYDTLIRMGEDPKSVTIDDWRQLAQGIQALQGAGKTAANMLGTRKTGTVHIKQGGKKIKLTDEGRAKELNDLKKQYNDLAPDLKSGTEGIALKDAAKAINPNIDLEANFKSNRNWYGTSKKDIKSYSTGETEIRPKGDGNWLNRGASSILRNRDLKNFFGFNKSAPATPATNSGNTTPPVTTPGGSTGGTSTPAPSSTPAQPKKSITEAIKESASKAGENIASAAKTTAERTGKAYGKTKEAIKKGRENASKLGEKGSKLAEKTKTAATNSGEKVKTAVESAKEAVTNLRSKSSKKVAELMNSKNNSKKPAEKTSVEEPKKSSEEKISKPKENLSKLSIQEKLKKAGLDGEERFKGLAKGSHVNEADVEKLKAHGFLIQHKKNSYIIKAQEGIKVALNDPKKKPSIFKTPNVDPASLSKLAILMGTNYAIHKMTQNKTPMAVTQSPITLARLNKAGISQIMPYLQLADKLLNTRNNLYSDAKLNTARGLEINNQANQLRTLGYNALLDTNMKIDQANADITNKEHIANTEAAYKNRAANTARQQLLLDDKKAILGKSSNALQAFIAEGLLKKAQLKQYQDLLNNIDLQQLASLDRLELITQFRTKYANQAAAAGMDIDTYLNNNSTVRQELLNALNNLQFETLRLQIKKNNITFAKKGEKFEEKVALAKYKSELTNYNRQTTKSLENLLKAVKQNSDNISKASLEKVLINKMLGK